jgi:hypothetical protein
MKFAEKMDFKSFDWRILKKYTSTSAVNDFNHFLENLPQHVTQSMLIAGGIAWLAAGITGVYTVVKTQELTKLRTELQEAEAINPVVPNVSNVPVSTAEITAFAEKLDKFYKNLGIKGQGSTITISGAQTLFFGEFREAVGHVLNGGQGWRVEIEKLCIGRECDKMPLSATLKINKVSVTNPLEN